jgi:tetratricopeptide (TPR) repeat protein
MQIKGRKWNMRQPRRRFNPLKTLFFLAVISFLVYVNIIVEPLSETIFLPSPTPTVSPETIIAEAEALANEGKYALALQVYSQAIMADPQNSALYISAARLHIYRGEYEEAIENASNALLLNQSSSMGEALKGFASGMLGQYLEAEGSLDRAIELDPSNSSAYAYLAIILSNKIQENEFVLGDLDRAIEASRTAESIAPSAIETHWSRAVVLENTQNNQEAVDELLKAIAINSNIADLHLILGRNYRALTDYDLAVEEYTRANALNPGSPLPELYISRVYFNIGEYDRAIQYAEQAVADSPEDPYLYGNLGVAYRKNYELDKALLILDLAVRGGQTPEGVLVEGIPINYGRPVEFYYMYGFTLADLGYCNDAVDIAQTILLTMDDDETAVWNANEILNDCYEQLNDRQISKLPAPTPIPTWTPRPSPTPTLMPTQEPSQTPVQ